MPTVKAKDTDFKVEIGIEEAKEWSAEQLARIKALAKEHAAKRSPERVFQNNYLGIKYRMEEYAETDERFIRKAIPLETFLNQFLEVFEISFRKFALTLEMNDANLRKYIFGERKFNADLAKRFGRFFHTSPLTWMKVYQLNDLINLRSDKVEKKYDKYDYTKVVDVLMEADSHVKEKTAKTTKIIVGKGKSVKGHHSKVTTIVVGSVKKSATTDKRRNAATDSGKYKETSKRVADKKK